MPHPIESFARHAWQLGRGAVPLALSPPVASTARWSTERARRWQDEVGWLVGCNFTPSTASNQLELWQADTFDPVTIDRELGWAADIGMNSIRVFLHDLLWAEEGEAFLDRVDRVLDLCAGHGITAMPVLFDGVWDPVPRLGTQPEPRPGLHNATWVQSPGAAALVDRSRWPALRRYVEAVVGRFARDPRVVVWDLFNEPDQPNAISYARQEIRDKTRVVGALVDEVFDWAQEVDPDQPLTAGVFTGVSGATERVSALNRTLLGRSDVISFHSYAPRRRLESSIRHLQQYRRPLLCTEWLGRTLGSTADLLEVFEREQVGAWCWGLVDGRTQTRFPWTTWLRPSPPDAPWFHELLHPDGRPYDERETALFRRLTGRPPATDGGAPSP